MIVLQEQVQVAISARSRPMMSIVPLLFIEMDRYLAEPPLLREGDPLYWWKAHAAAYPILSKLAKASLCFVATSVPCEQIFSQTGLIISDRRTKLKPSKVRELIYLKANSKFV